MKYSTHFGEAKKEYVQFRPQYPSTLFETILKNTPRPYLKAVDLGAGAGISTIFLSRFQKLYLTPKKFSNMNWKITGMHLEMND